MKVSNTFIHTAHDIRLVAKNRISMDEHFCIV